MSVRIDEDLDGEDDGEEGVELLQLIPERGRQAAVVCEHVHDLRLRRVDNKVLRASREFAPRNKRRGGGKSCRYNARRAGRSAQQAA